MTEQNFHELDSMTTKVYTPKEWLVFYKNTWTKNLMARTLDFQRAKAEAELNPHKRVEAHDGTLIRADQMKELTLDLVRHAVLLLGVIDRLLQDAEIDSLSFVDKYWSVKALEIDAIEKKYGDACQTEDGKPGTLISDSKGDFVCREL